LVVDVEGQILGRAASKIATLLRGKHKASFTPHVDCGDNVIVLNADKVRMTGKKWAQKEYIRHTGYPGGQRTVIAATMLQKHPERIVENAVRGMLPKNSLGRNQFRHLKVYLGSEHPHEAQEPEAYQL
jgi:large subunit ribosomal protein L13